jgi:hypothetical protein
MKIKITDSDVMTFNALKGKILMRGDEPRIYIIDDFKTEEVSETVMEKPGLLKRAVPVVKTRIFLTEMNIFAWHSTGKFLGTLKEDSVEWLLHCDLYRIRRNWTDFCDQLKAFGFKVTKIKAEEDLDMEKAAEAHLKEFFKTEGYENQQDIIKYAVSFAKSLK